MAVRVLIVDDVDDVRLLVRTALRLRGNVDIVGEAADGESAVALVTETQPDVIVLDLGIPGIAGHDLIAKIREECPLCKVIVFTGTDVVAEDAIRTSVDRFVLKQADVYYLVDLVVDIAQDPARAGAASLQLDQAANSPARARQFVRDRCREWGLLDVVDDAVLITSELVTNAVQHAQTPAELRLVHRPTVLRIEVHDRGAGFPDVLAPDIESEHGRGMVLTSAFCSAWGVDAQSTEKVVWAELPLWIPRQRTNDS